MGQTEDMSPFFPGALDTSGWDPHFVIVRSARVWVDIDLLFDGEDDHQGSRPDPATARGLRPTGQLARMACAQTCRWPHRQARCRARAVRSPCLRPELL